VTHPPAGQAEHTLLLLLLLELEEEEEEEPPLALEKPLVDRRGTLKPATLASDSV
jgi:hypothetical protein